MNVFSDFHQADLRYSLQILFEKRLGGQLFRPIGVEWFTNGFWKIAEPYGNDPGTIEQYLGMNSMPKDHSPSLNDPMQSEDGIIFFRDKHNNSTNKGITFDKFKETKIDIVIATIPEHIEPFKKLVKEYQPQAKFIFQVGNIGWDQSTNFSQVPNLMSSTIEYPIPSSTNAVFYHQEFDLDIFKPQGKTPKKQIVSFINCLGQTGWGSQYYDLKNTLPEYEFFSYGGSCDNGIVNTTQEIANIINDSYFGFHAKMFGDGFGHIFHNWFACGKPIITHISDYKNKLGGKLLKDMETCIDLDIHTIYDTSNIIRNLKPSEYEYICQQCYQVFKENVDYDQEQTKIEEFLSKLQ